MLCTRLTYPVMRVSRGFLERDSEAEEGLLYPPGPEWARWQPHHVLLTISLSGGYNRHWAFFEKKPDCPTLVVLQATKQNNKSSAQRARRGSRVFFSRFTLLLLRQRYVFVYVTLPCGRSVFVFVTLP